MADNFTIEQVGEAYAHGSTQYKENEQIKNTINAINLKLYKGEEGPELEVFKHGLALSYDYIEKITQRLGSKFEQYFPKGHSHLRLVLCGKSHHQSSISYHMSKRALLRLLFARQQ